MQWTVGLAAGKQGDQPLKHIDHALKGTNGNELVDAVAAVGAGGQVGAGQPAEGELRAVGAATDGDDVRLYASRLKGLLGGIDELRVVGDNLSHVAILLFDLNMYAVFAQVGIHKVGDAVQPVDLLGKLAGAVVANNIARGGVVHCARDALYVVEALVAGGVLGALGLGQHAVETREEIGGVHHTVFGVAGVNGIAVKSNRGFAGVEALPFQLADRAAVYGIGV